MKISRFRFLVPMLGALALPAAASAQAPSGIVLGVPAPLSGSSEILGRQVVAGVAAATGRIGEDSVRMVEADTACSAEGGTAAAERLVAESAQLAVGFLCTAALEAALPVLSRAGIGTLVVGVRANRITDDRQRSGHLVWRIAPRSDAEAAAIAETIAARWREAPFGLVDDGTIYARGLSDVVRNRLEEMGLKPTVIDTYRPAEEKQFGLARRIERTGVTRFFVAGDRPDIAVIARDAASLGLNLEILAGESLLDESSIDVPLPAGVLAVAPARQFLDTGGGDAAALAGLEGYGLPAAVAAEVAITALRLSRERNVAVADVLNGETFATSLGPLRFDPNGDSDLKHFGLLRWDGHRFVPEAEG